MAPGKEKWLLSVIVPCFNEKDNLRELCARIHTTFKRGSIAGEVILIDDGSSDETWEMIQLLIAEYGDLIVGIQHKTNLGIESGWQSGLRHAKGKYIVIIDADLQYQPEDMLRLYNELIFSNVDIVQGWRSQINRVKDIRYYLSRGLSRILNLLFGNDLWDPKSGFLICERQVFEEAIFHRYKYRYFQTFIVISAISKDYYVKQTEVLFEERKQGKSFVTTYLGKLVLWSFLDILKGFFEFRLLSQKESILAAFLQNEGPVEVPPEKSPFWRRFLFNLYIYTIPLHTWMISKSVKNYYQELKVSQWLSREKIKELQNIKLQKLIRHAYRHVPYYRDIMNSLGLTPEDVRTVDDLQKLPLLSKDDVRKNLYFNILSDNHDKRKVLKITTSGSTGEPFICYADKTQLEYRWACTLRAMEWTGYRFGDRQVRLWHQTIGMNFMQIAKEFLNAFLSRRRFIPSYEMSDDTLHRFFKKLKKNKPILIDGYAESLNFLAYFLKNNSVQRLKPRGIISSAQTLPNGSRRTIEEQFGCKVFDKYGSREFSGIAYECDAHIGHHVMAESYIVEILIDGRPAKPGEMGEVVITDLNNFCLPFIRYRIGDLAEALDDTTCQCGRGLTLIGKIEGRVQSIVIGSNNQYIPGTFFAHFFKDYDYVVRHFQIIQERYGEITLKIVKNLRYSDSEMGKIKDQLKKYLGKDMKINLEFLKEIPMVSTGKRNCVISKLQIDFQNIRVRK